MKILYLEDNVQEASLVSRYMRTTSHDLVLATSMDEARDAAASLPDLILVDLVLGHTRDGFSFIRELREQGCLQPIIAITGLSTPADLQKCHDVGADDILVKPFAISQLAKVIDQYTS